MPDKKRLPEGLSNTLSGRQLAPELPSAPRLGSHWKASGCRRSSRLLERDGTEPSITVPAWKILQEEVAKGGVSSTPVSIRCCKTSLEEQSALKPHSRVSHGAVNGASAKLLLLTSSPRFFAQNEGNELFPGLRKGTILFGL